MLIAPQYSQLEWEAYLVNVSRIHTYECKGGGVGYQSHPKEIHAPIPRDDGDNLLEKSRGGWITTISCSTDMV